MSPAEQQMLVRSTQAWTFSEHSCTSVPCALFNSFTPIPWILFLVNGRQMSKERMTIKGEKPSGTGLQNILGELGQVDHKFKVCLSCSVSSNLPWAT